jgi:hypothetical protein
MHCQKSLKGPGTVLNGFPSKQAYTIGKQNDTFRTYNEKAMKNFYSHYQLRRFAPTPPPPQHSTSVRKNIMFMADEKVKWS